MAIKLKALRTFFMIQMRETGYFMNKLAANFVLSISHK